MSLARQHREKILASMSAAVAPSVAGGLAPTNGSPVAIAAQQIALRLMHDQRRLKQIQSLEGKIAAKREMLPEYEAWISGLLEAGQATGHGSADPVLPTIMVWRIDTGDYAGGLRLAAYVLEHDVPLPAQYQRKAPTLIVEEVADAALQVLLDGTAFDLPTLEYVEELTADYDMPDEVRAKLCKAIGFELARQGEAQELTGKPLLERAAVALKRAQQLHNRSGAKVRLQKVEKALRAFAAAPPAPATPTPVITDDGLDPALAAMVAAQNTAGTAG